MKLPAGERAVIDDAKLLDYCLSATHPRGRHKARLFEAVFGITIRHAMLLRSALVMAARDGEAEAGVQDEYGTRYQIVSELVGPTGSGRIVSAWIVPNLQIERVPRLITCYPWLKDSDGT